MTPAQLAELAPQFNWPLLLTRMGLEGVPTLIIRKTMAIQADGQLFAATRWIPGRIGSLSTSRVYSPSSCRARSMRISERADEERRDLRGCALP